MKRQILPGVLILLFIASFATADTIHVPGGFPYIDIQQAINIAQSGDVIIIAPGTYIGTGYDIDKGITITGTDPNNPYVVAATVIDFLGWPPGHVDVLAFDLHGPRSVLRGITIANSYRGQIPVSDGVNPGDDGEPGHDGRLGMTGINIRGNHIISNCIIRNCLQDASGNSGGNGADGDANDYPGDPNADPVHHGGSGGRGGHRYGSGIYIDSGSPLILNTVVEDCIAIGGPGGGAGVGLDADTGVPADPNLGPGGPGGNGGNGGNAMGAGVYCAGGTNPTFRNCIFRNNQAYAGDANDGGAGGDGAIEEPNSLFPGGRGGHGGVPGLVRGAGVYFRGTNATFTDCQFIGNRAYGGIAGDGNDSGEIHLAMDWIRGGHGGLVEDSYPLPPGGTPQNGRPPSDFSAKGAGVYIEQGSAATFTGCTFRDNVTRGSVSGLGGYPSWGYREHPHTNFPIPTYGAGVYCDDGTTTTFTDCTIQGNWTTQEPNQYEGDLYPYGSHPDPDFDYADVEYTGYGGGMCFVNGHYVELNHCNIADNNAPVGGGVCASSLTDFHVDECNFVNNWAYLGAGLFSIDNYSTISSSTFTGNRADDPNGDLYGSGGGLFSFSTDVLISDCTFSENTTNGFGGGIYMAGEVAIPPLTAEPVLKNCLLSNNEAGLDGGGIYCDWYTKPDIINCTITGNEARGDPPFGVGYGGGLYCSYESDVNIINSIVWGNAGPNTIGPELAVETWSFFPPTTLTVSYCDVEGGEEEVWVDDDSTLNWGAGNKDEDPLFVTGPLGDYYLSQTEVGDPNQTSDSPCVDAGSGSAISVGMSGYTTRTDELFDRDIVDMGYHHLIILAVEECRVVDLFLDHFINFKDFAILALNWLGEGCSDANDWCQGADVTFDGNADWEDLEFYIGCWLVEDVCVPFPNPSEWAIEPYSSSLTSIDMAAKTTVDTWGGDVEYYFECVYGDCSDSGWQSDPNYTDSGLDPNTEYGYRVRAKDSRCGDISDLNCTFDPNNPNDPNAPNRTDWSDIRYAITGEEAPETDPPSPDPSEWEIAPYPISSSEIGMTATEADDPSGGVQYQFECVSGGGHSSGWQPSREYTDTGLAALTEYCYTVRTRDVHNNTGDYSANECATTLP